MRLLLVLLVLCVSHVCSSKVFISGNVVDHNALNLLEDIEEFYAHKFSEEFKVFSNKFLLLRVDFSPDVLDFGDRPLSKPTRVEVVLRNLDSDHSFEIVATFGNNEDFLWSRFNQTVLSPAASASFNVTFLPQRVGASEATIYIATSRGLLRYQVFGSGYPNPVDPFHMVRVVPSKQNYIVAVLDVFNPSVHTLKVEYLALCISPLDTPENSDSCISQPTESCVIENKFLYPHRRTELLRMEMAIKIFTSMRGLLVLSTSTVPAYLDSDCTDMSCHTDKSFLYGGTSKSDPSDWVTLAFPLHTRYISSLELFATTSLLDFGTLTSDSEPSVLTLDLINHSRYPIKITNVAANGSHPALSIRIANQTVLGQSSNSYTVAVITVSAKHISSSVVLSDFITAFSDDRRTYVKVPYYARLVYGTLVTRIANSSADLPSSTGLHYQVFLQNRADIPVIVRQLALPRALQQLVTVHNQSNSSSVLQPNAEQMLLNLSMRYLPTAQVVGSLTVVTNVSTINIPMEVFSGHIHVRIPTARLLSEVFDFGHVPLGRRRTTTIVLHNGNPFDLTIDSFLLSTVASEDQVLKLSRRASSSLCVPSCRLSSKGQTCSSCFEHIAQNSTLTYPVEWGGSQVAGEITGFLLLRSTHHQIIRQFRFHVGVGELTMLPDPMTIDDLFPGKLVQRNIIVQSTYTKPADLNRLALTTRSGLIPDSLRLFNQHGELASDVGLHQNPVTLSANKPTLVGSVLFNPSLDCRDLLEQFSGQNQTSEPVNRDICYTGFNLNSNQGRELLSTMTDDHTDSDWRSHFRSGLFLTAQLYTSLRSAWVRKQVSIASEHQSDSTGTHISDAFVGFGVSTDTSLFWGDLAVSYTWPRIVSLKKPSARRGIVNNCVLKNATSKSDRRSSDSYPFSDFGQPLRAHFPTTVWTEPVYCDLVIANPSDRPLVIQPFLLDAVYTVPQNYSKSCFSTDPLVGFLQTLGLPAAQETMSKLSKLIAGSFNIQTLDTSLAYNYSTLDPDVVAPDCCPILLLPPRVGQVTFRLTFTPEPNLQPSDPWVPLPAIPFTAASHNLLFIRNNLTALEPIWLNALQGKAALALGLVRANQKDEEVAESEADTSGYFLDNKQNGSSRVQVLLEARWNRAKFSGSVPESTVASDWTTSTNTVTEDTPTLLFDFTERLFWPFCTEDRDPLLVYSLPDSDTQSDWTDFHPFGTMLHSFEQRGEMLASVSIRRLIVLINTGDVPIYLKLLSVGPDDLEFSSTKHIEQIHPRLESDQLTCSYAGFRLTPCILPREQIATPHLLDEDATASSHYRSAPYVLRPGTHLSLELRHHPDFVHTSFAARLWIVAHPQSSDSEGKEHDSSSANWNLCGNASSPTACDLSNASRQSLLRLTATFPRPFLYTCLNALPRPWIENLMWAPVVILFLVNLIAVLLMGSIDGSKIHTNHMKFRTDIDRFGFNSVPDPMHVFSFDRLTGEPGPTVSNSIESPTDVKRPCESVDRQQGGKKCLTTQPTASPVQSVDSGKSTLLWRLTGSLPRVFFWAGRTVLAVGRVTKVSALFIVQRMLTPSPPKNNEPSTVTKATVSVVAQKKLKKAGSSPDARGSGSPASHLSDTVGESDGDSGKLGRSSVSKTLATKSAGTRSIQSKTLNSDEAKSNRYSRRTDASRGNVASDTVKSLLRKKKTNKSDPVPIADSRSPCRGADSDTGNDTSSTIRGPAVQDQPDENDAPMTEARIAAAVRATRKLAEDLTSHARKKGIQNKQNTRSKFNACTSSASSSSGPDHDNPKISPTNTMRNPSMQAPTLSKTKQKGWHPSGSSVQLEETSDQPNLNIYNRKAQLHQQCQSKMRPMGYSPVAYSDLFSPALDRFHYSVLQPEYGFCWPIPQEASIPTQPLLTAGAPFISLSTPWDDAVADVNSIWEHDSSEWNEDLISMRASPDSVPPQAPPSAMDQIAADTRAFAESLLQYAPKDLAEHFSPTRMENGLQAIGAEDTSPLSMTGHSVFSAPASSIDRSVHFSNLDPWASDFHPTSPWSPTTKDAIPMKSTAEVGTLTSPSMELPSEAGASMIHDAFEPATTAFEEVGLNSQRTTNVTACNICCGHLMGREEDDTIKQSKPVNGFDSMRAFACSHQASRPSDISQTFFYELPQITQARRQIMLEHECRVQANEPAWHILAGLKRPESNSTSSEPEELRSAVPGLTETTTDAVVSSSSKTNTTTMRRRGKQRKKTRNESSSPVVDKQSDLFKDCITLPTIRSPWSDQGRTADGVLPELPVFRPWEPLNAISTKELLRELGLDETDQLLSFGSSFSYHDYKAWDPLTTSSNPWTPTDAGSKPTCE